MKAQARNPLLVPESLSGTTASTATAGMQAGTTSMEIDTGAGTRAPSMSQRFGTEGQSHSTEWQDELHLLMALDSDTPVETQADNMHWNEAGQQRPRLNWPPLPAGSPVLVVPAERLEVIRIAKETGLLVPAQQGLSGQGLDAQLRAHCIAPPIIPAPVVDPAPATPPAPTIPPAVPVFWNKVPADWIVDDYKSVPAIGEEDNDDPSVSREITSKLLECRHTLAATGSAPLQDLIELLAENGGARHSRFHDGEAARIDITLKLVDLLDDMVAMHGTPQARFDQESLDRFGRSLLQWCGRSAYLLGRREQVRRYSVGMPDMVDENIINTIILNAMCRSEKTRDFIIGIFSENETELRENFRMSTKIKILRQCADGEVALNAAETLALCTLKLSYNSSADRLLFILRSHAGQLSLNFTAQGAGQGASTDAVMQ